MDTNTLRKLAKICWEKDKILVVARAYGMIGYVRIVTKSHEIIEGKPDNEVKDLRLTNPWPELLKFCEIQDLNNMDKETHSHTPYIVILLNLLKQWKESHNGKSPETRKEKEEFTNLIKKAALNITEQKNFQEALQNVFHCWTPPEIPEPVQEILQDKRVDNITKDSSDFWIMAAALKLFVKSEGCLPLIGSVPDMEADTDRYVKLQSLYVFYF